MLLDHTIIEEGDQQYGKLYFLTDQFEQHRDDFKAITDQLE